MNPKFERLSALATISRHQTALAIGSEIITAKSIDARLNPRKREILVLHNGDSDTLQRMINALQPGSYIRPHRHHTPPKAETLVLLTGSVGFVPFFDDGRPDTENFVLLHQSKGAVAVDYRESVWHTFLALEADTVIFEVKPGPYDAASDKEFALWSPAENSPEAEGYLQSLEDMFRQQFRLPA